MTLAALEKRFHHLIKDRLRKVGLPTYMDFPVLDAGAIGEDAARWFAIDGMQGGFRYWLEERDGELVVIAESSSRVVPDAEERHLVSLRNTIPLPPR